LGNLEIKDSRISFTTWRIKDGGTMKKKPRRKIQKREAFLIQLKAPGKMWGGTYTP